MTSITKRVTKIEQKVKRVEIYLENCKFCHLKKDEKMHCKYCHLKNIQSSNRIRNVEHFYYKKRK